MNKTLDDIYDSIEELHEKIDQLESENEDLRAFIYGKLDVVLTATTIMFITTWIYMYFK